MLRFHRQLPFVLFLVLSTILTIFLYTDTPTPKSNQAGTSFPKDELAEMFNAQPRTEPKVFYNFFASWCTPCIAEIPYLDVMRKKYNMTIVGIAWDKNQPALEQFFKDHGKPFDDVYVDANGKAAQMLSITGLPESFLVGSDGSVHYHHRGPITRKEFEQLLPLIE